MKYKVKYIYEGRSTTNTLDAEDFNIVRNTIVFYNKNNKSVYAFNNVSSVEKIEERSNMNKEMYKKREEFWKLKEKFTELGGSAKILSEVKKIIELHNEENFLDKLKQYLDEKEREFWKESTPIAKKLCDVNIEMAEIYMKYEEGENK